MTRIALLSALLGMIMVGILPTETQAQSLSISGTGVSVTKPQCANGKNDDGQPGIDLNDPDCANSLDNSERASTTTSSLTTLQVSQSISQSTTPPDLGLGDPRDIDCRAFGKGGGNPDKYEAILACILTPLEISARCVNNGNQALITSPQSAHVVSGPITAAVQLDSGDVTGRGLWAASALIPGSFLLEELAESLVNVCPSLQWRVLPSSLLLIKTGVSIKTFADGVLKDEENLGTCTLNADLETYTCKLSN